MDTSELFTSYVLLWLEFCPLKMCMFKFQSLISQNVTLLKTGSCQMKLVKMRSHWRGVASNPI